VRGSTNTEGKATGKVPMLKDKDVNQNNGALVGKALDFPC